MTKNKQSNKLAPTARRQALIDISEDLQGTGCPNFCYFSKSKVRDFIDSLDD